VAIGKTHKRFVGTQKRNFDKYLTIRVNCIKLINIDSYGGKGERLTNNQNEELSGTKNGQGLNKKEKKKWGFDIVYSQEIKER
jgi:hypothetical protein